MIRTNVILPMMEEPNFDRESNQELHSAKQQEDLEATLLERLEACELTWKIVDSGLLEEH